MFVELLIGIHPGDLDCLRHTFWNMYGYSLESAILEEHLKDNFDCRPKRETPLRFAIKTALAIRRPPPETPVDLGQVRSDVITIRRAFERGHLYYEMLLEILLRSSDSHIAQIASHYLTTVHVPLDIEIDASAHKDVTKAIAIQALRSATNVVYRDVMLLKDTGHKISSDKVTLGIRVCRMHWYAHWPEIKAEFKRATKRGLDQKRLEDGLFGELIASMAEE